MAEYEDFLVSLYQAKLQWKAILSEHCPVSWDSSIQKKIDALSSFSEFEIESHAIAAKNYFKEEINYSEILEVIRIGCVDKGNEKSFTVCLFNRLKLLAARH